MNFTKHFLVYKGLPKDVYLLFLSNVINKMGSFIMPLMVLILTRKIGFSESEAGLFSTISMVTQAPFIMLGGKLADKFGSKKTIVLFNFLGALVYLFCGFMKPSLALAVLIIIASDLYVIAYPAFSSIIAEITPPPVVKNAYSLMYLGLNLGLVAGPVLGGILFNYLYLLFILDAFTTLVSTALIFFFVKYKEDKSLLQVDLSEESEQSEQPEKTEQPERTDHAGPANSNSIFAFLYMNPALIVFSATFIIYNFCYGQWGFMLPLQVANIFKENGPGFYSLLVSINACTVIFATPFLTSVTQKTSSLKSILIGGIFYAASFMMFSLNRFMVIFIISIIVMTIGEILISININNYIAQRTPKALLGRANSMLSIVNGIGYAIGPVIMGNLIMSVSFQNAWLIVTALMLLGAFLTYLIKRFEKIDGSKSLGNASVLEND